MEKHTYTRLMPLLNSHFEDEELVIPTIHWNLTFSATTVIFRQALALSLALIFMINAIGYYPLFKIKQWQIRTEMKAAIKNSLSNEHLKCITVTSSNSNDLVWEEYDEREFTYQHNKYDVVRVEKSAGATSYYCIQDTQETKLFAELDEDVKRQLEDDKNPLRRTTKKIIKTFSCMAFLVYYNSAAQQEMRRNLSFQFINSTYEYDFSDQINLPPEQSV